MSALPGTLSVWEAWCSLAEPEGVATPACKSCEAGGLCEAGSAGKAGKAVKADMAWTSLNELLAVLCLRWVVALHVSCTHMHARLHVSWSSDMCSASCWTQLLCNSLWPTTAKSLHLSMRTLECAPGAATCESVSHRP